MINHGQRSLGYYQLDNFTYGEVTLEKNRGKKVRIG